MPTVTHIARCHGAPRARHVIIDDMPWRVLPIAVLDELGLRSGETVELESLNGLIRDTEPRMARARAIALIAYRERCAAEITHTLTAEGYSCEAVGGVVEDLKSIGLIDDARFSEAQARTLLEIKGFGRTRALREMTACGLDRDQALSALDACAPLEDEYERAAETARRMVRPRDTVNSLAQRLVRKGYEVSASLQAARERVGEGSADCDDSGWAEPDTPEDTPESPEE